MSEPDVSDLITVQQAIAIIDAADVAPQTKIVALAETAGLILAEDLHADRDFPPFDKSLMDGYAVRVADVTGSARLRVTGEVAAGAAADIRVNAGEAIAIMTGRADPRGADVVVPVEDVVVDGDSIRLSLTTSPGRFIAKRGSDYGRRRDRAAERRPVSARPDSRRRGGGAANARVFARPKVAILSTGDEIVPVDQSPGPSQIRNSNGPMMHALLAALGCEVTDPRPLRDDRWPFASDHEKRRRDALFITEG